MESLDIIRIKNKLKDPLHLVHLNLIYEHRIIVEISIRYGKKPINLYANHFLYELARSDTAD